MRSHLPDEALPDRCFVWFLSYPDAITKITCEKVGGTAVSPERSFFHGVPAFLAVGSWDGCRRHVTFGKFILSMNIILARTVYHFLVGITENCST